MKMTLRPNGKVGRVLSGFLVAIGVLVVLAEVAMRIASFYLDRPFELDHTILIAGAVLGFWGFWMINPEKTKEGVEVLTDFVPRFGRRKTDPIAQPDTVTTIVPTRTSEFPSPTVAVKHEEKPDGSTR